MLAAGATGLPFWLQEARSETRANNVSVAFIASAYLRDREMRNKILREVMWGLPGKERGVNPSRSNGNLEGHHRGDCARIGGVSSRVIFRTYRANPVSSRNSRRGSGASARSFF